MGNIIAKFRAAKIGALMAACVMAFAAAQPRIATAALTDPSIGRYTFSELAEKVGPSLVTVLVSKRLSDDERKQLDGLRKQFQGPGLGQSIPPELREFFQLPEDTPDTPDDTPEDLPDDFEMQRGSGSGVVISDDGYILTNYHVVGGMDKSIDVTVVFSDDTQVKGEDVTIVYAHQLTDLALLKVKPEALKKVKEGAVKAMEWGKSDDLKIGEMVAAVGSPLGLSQTITAGIICAKHRDVGAAGLGDMIQTDAVINPGSSGGALVNLDGQLVGINRLITTRTGMWQGYGFAIPADDAHHFCDEVIKTGKMNYGYIGITMGGDAEDTPAMREANGIDKDQQGVLIVDVRKDQPSPAADAGLRQGDFITEVDGKKVTSNTELLQIVARKAIGDVVKVTALRSDRSGKSKEMDFSLKIAQRPDEDKLVDMLKGNRDFPGKPKLDKSDRDSTPGNLGMDVSPFDQGAVKGLKVDAVQPHSPAARAGVKAGDILISLNYEAVTSGDELEQAAKARKSGSHILSILRENRPILLPLKIGTDKK